MFSVFLLPGHQAFCLPAQELVGTRLEERVTISLASDPSTALRGTDHPSWHPQGCRQHVWGRLTTAAIAQH